MQRPEYGGQHLHDTPIIDRRNWRGAIDPEKVTFDDKKKFEFLKHYFRHGKKGIAARQAGVNPSTVNNHLKEDPDFLLAFTECRDARAEMIVSRLETEALEGIYEPIFDKDGVHVGDKLKLETNLRLAVLKRYDPAYKENSGTTINNNVAGVVVMPAVTTKEEWTKNAAAHKAVTPANTDEFEALLKKTQKELNERIASDK